MKSPRFHAQKADGLYRPIPFLFVTDRMCREILSEREEIMAAMPTATRQRQQTLFARYDPNVSAEAFTGLLNLFDSRPA
jgi:hypothetical protein